MMLDKELVWVYDIVENIICNKSMTLKRDSTCTYTFIIAILHFFLCIFKLGFDIQFNEPLLSMINIFYFISGKFALQAIVVFKAEQEAF